MISSVCAPDQRALSTTSPLSGERTARQSLRNSAISLIRWIALVWFAAAPRIKEQSTSSGFLKRLYPRR